MTAVLLNHICLTWLLYTGDYFTWYCVLTLV